MNNRDGEVSENTEYLAGLFMELLEQLDKAIISTDTEIERPPNEMGDSI